MPLPLPNLDDRNYADLVAEARSRLPAYCPAWTDHNASDPGIMLVELFAWLTEMLLYRSNRVPERHVVTFLKLLRGPDWQPSKDLAENVRETVLSLRRAWRAVTAEDYQTLAVKEAAPKQVERAHCLARRDLDAPDERGKLEPRPGRVSVILVPPGGDVPVPSQELCETVREFLDQRRLITTRLHVVGPVYVSVKVRVTVVRRRTVADTSAAIQQAVAEALRAFLHPLTGGPIDPATGRGRGWPFGGAVYVSDLYPVLQAVPGVDSLETVVVSGDEKTRELRHKEGDLIGVALEEHHLPRADVSTAHVTVKDPPEGQPS